MTVPLRHPILAALVAAASLWALPAGAQQATGAGSTFAAPVYARWAADYYKATGAKINYQSIGSSAGIQQINAKTVDFGASDMPLADDALARDGLIQFPVVIGGVIPVVNLGGIAPGQLKLDGLILGEIFLGRIRKWNDPAIRALNPALPLPDAAISPVRRADGSGTTFLFTDYLSKTDPQWKKEVGVGTAVNWPTGAGAKGNEGVAALVGRIPNSIGYVEYAYVKQNRMTYALLRNAAGQFVAPDAAAFKAAATGANWSASFYQILTDQPGSGAWPIVGATYVLIHKSADKPAQTAAVLGFFDWAYRHGDASAQAIDYVPLPAAVKSAVQRSWSAVKDPSGQPVAYPGAARP